MHLLMRKISAYTGDDLLLGVFRTLEEAERGRREYLSSVVHGTSDPWAEQAYHEVSDEDVVILPSLLRLDLAESADRVFVVSSYSEGFGQVSRSFEAIAGSNEAARDHVAALTAKDEGEFPYWCGIDEVLVGELSQDPSGHHQEGQVVADLSDSKPPAAPSCASGELPRTTEFRGALRAPAGLAAAAAALAESLHIAPDRIRWHQRERDGRESFVIATPSFELRALPSSHPSTWLIEGRITGFDAEPFATFHIMASALKGVDAAIDFIVG